ncbi:MAG: membrane dipeptidase [Vicinamibacterales bacterium]
MRSPHLLLVLAVSSSLAVLSAQAPSGDTDLVRRARAIHDRVIALDTHNDIEPENFVPARNYTQRLNTQVNLPKMIEGGLDASFFIVYVGQPNLKDQPDALSPAGYDRAYKQAVAKFDAVHRLTEQIAPDKIGLALTADDVRKISASGRKVALIGVENGWAIGEDLRRVKEFYDRGGRYMSLAHNGNNQLSDSNTGERDGYMWKDGISPMGERVIAEMNRVGMMVDVSHPSRGSMLKAAELSKAPIIASHSAVRALCNVPRNMDDDMLKALAKTDGVVQVVGFSSYIKTPKPDSPERAAALTALRASSACRRRHLARPLAHPVALASSSPLSPPCQLIVAPSRPQACRHQHAHAGRSACDGQGLRQPHRLRREVDRHRPRRHFVRLRRWWRAVRLARCQRDVQRHARTRAARLHRGRDRQDLERQPASRDGPRPGRRQAAAGAIPLNAAFDGLAPLSHQSTSSGAATWGGRRFSCRVRLVHHIHVRTHVM